MGCIVIVTDSTLQCQTIEISLSKDFTYYLVLVFANFSTQKGANVCSLTGCLHSVSLRKCIEQFHLKVNLCVPNLDSPHSHSLIQSLQNHHNIWCVQPERLQTTHKIENNVLTWQEVVVIPPHICQTVIYIEQLCHI